jgi:uncharacterized protein YeaO (DUF488 family)
MALTVYTAPLAYDGDDGLDVSRWGNHRLGVVFAPSESLLYTATRKRSAGRLTHEAWAQYRDAYLVELRASYRAQRPAWDELLARSTVTLCCFCASGLPCHRVVLAGVLVKLGAQYEGER